MVSSEERGLKNEPWGAQENLTPQNTFKLPILSLCPLLSKDISDPIKPIVLRKVPEYIVNTDDTMGSA